MVQPSGVWDVVGDGRAVDYWQGDGQWGIGRVARFFLRLYPPKRDDLDMDLTATGGLSLLARYSHNSFREIKMAKTKRVVQKAPKRGKIKISTIKKAVASVKKARPQLRN